MEGVSLYPEELLEAEVAAFADRMCATPDFARAVDHAERYILEQSETTIAAPVGDERRISQSSAKISGAVENFAAHGGEALAEPCASRIDIEHVAIGRNVR